MSSGQMEDTVITTPGAVGGGEESGQEGGEEAGREQREQAVSAMKYMDVDGSGVKTSGSAA